MDIVAGLTAARLAFDLAKDLREINGIVEDATAKLKLAELNIALADVKIALSDARIREAELLEKIRELESGGLCPKCKVGRLEVVRVKAGIQAGQEWHDVSCSDEQCEYETSRKYLTGPGKYAGA